MSKKNFQTFVILDICNNTRSVGHLDISYPSNKKLFAPILDSPTDLALIAKGANANMLQSGNGTEFGPFRLKTEPDMWGSLWNKKQVHNELPVIFEYIYYRVWRKGSESLLYCIRQPLGYSKFFIFLCEDYVLFPLENRSERQ